MKNSMMWLLLLVAGCGPTEPSTPVIMPSTVNTLPPPVIPMAPRESKLASSPVTSQPTAPTAERATPPVDPTPVPLPPKIDKPTELVVPELLPSQVFEPSLRETGSDFSLSPDGETIGIKGWPPGTRGDDGDSRRCVYYSLKTGKPVGTPIKSDNLGEISTGGKTAMTRIYVDESREYDIAVRDLTADTQTIFTRVSYADQQYSGTPAGDLVVLLRNKRQMHFLRVPSGKPALPPLAMPDSVLDLSRVYAAGTRVATLLPGGRIAFWDVTTGRAAGELRHDRPADVSGFIVVAADGGTVMTHTRDAKDKNTISFWDIPTGKKHSYPSPKSTFDTLDGPMAGGLVHHIVSDVTGTGFGRIVIALTDLASGRDRVRLTTPPTEKLDDTFSRAILTSADGRRLVMRSRDRYYVWDIPTKKD